MSELPFYSRKYKRFFKTYEDFERFAKYEIRKRLIEKQSAYKGKAYLPSKYRKGYEHY